MADHRTIAVEVRRSNPSRRSWLAVIAGLVAAMIAAFLLFRAWNRPVDDPQSLRGQAGQLARIGRWEDAESLLARLEAPAPEDRLLRAFAAHSLGRDDDAATYLGLIPADGPLAVQVALLTGKVEQGRARARPMEEALLRAIRLDPKQAEARRLLVYLYGVQERRDDLLAQFAALAEQGPITFDLLWHWWIAHRDKTMNEPAVIMPDLERFIANDPDDRWSKIALANAHLASGDPARAREILAALPLTDPEVRACRAQIEIDGGDFDAAALTLSEGSADHPKLARLRGRLAVKRNEPALAVRSLKIADDRDPNNPYILYELLTAFRLSGDHAAAESLAPRVGAHQALRQFLDRDGPYHEKTADFYCRVASAFEAASCIAEARAWYRLAITLDPLHQRAQQAAYRLSASIPAISNPP